MSKNTDPKPENPKLKLTVRDIRELQEKHGIKNLLAPKAEDTEKILTLDFLCDAVKRGTEWMGDSKPDPDDMQVSELVDLFKTFHTGKS